MESIKESSERDGKKRTTLGVADGPGPEVDSSKREHLHAELQRTHGAVEVLSLVREGFEEALLMSEGKSGRMQS